MGTLVDPALCRADRLLGMVMSTVGKGPSIYTEIKAEGESLRLGLQEFCHRVSQLATRADGSD